MLMVKYCSRAVWYVLLPGPAHVNYGRVTVTTAPVNPASLEK